MTKTIELNIEIDTDEKILYIGEDYSSGVKEHYKSIKDISNYVYEKPSVGKSHPINYRSALPQNVLFTWSEVKHFKISQNILMHSVIYRTQMLKDCKLELPKHTFYVDNVFVYQPLPSVKLMYYLDVNLYRYFIGRDDQSVNEKIMIQRIDQQIKVNKILIDAHDLSKIEDEKLRSYMVKFLAMIMIPDVSKLMNNNIINESFVLIHKIQREIQIVFTGARAIAFFR